MINNIVLLAVEKLQGGNYTIDTIIQVIRKITDWALRIGISVAGVSLVIGFIVFSVVDVDQKPRAKQRIIQTLLGIGGIIIAISLVNIVIGLFN